MKKSEHTLSSKEYYWKNRASISAWKKARLKNGRENSYRDFVDQVNIFFMMPRISHEFDEEKWEVEDECCSEFGCPKTLTRTEKLAGNKCLKHQVYIRKIF